ncbi:MAG: lipid-A-disaccharide synthase, partial [Chlamydiia bacterium]|nr:lipid-A-disaccharide synthase [Chlamydiia bacterium]
MNYDIFIFAGEPSGDLHGEALIQEIRKKDPSLKIAAVAGPRMRALGIDCILPMEEFQVMGFFDVFCALPRLIKHFYFIGKQILAMNPRSAIFIDYPGFNLRMEKHLKKRGFKAELIHYICPSVWVHGKGRIKTMESSLSQLLCILPFEKLCFEGSSLPVTYVGHP